MYPKTSWHVFYIFRLTASGGCWQVSERLHLGQFSARVRGGPELRAGHGRRAVRTLRLRHRSEEGVTVGQPRDAGRPPVPREWVTRRAVMAAGRSPAQSWRRKILATGAAIVAGCPEIVTKTKISRLDLLPNTFKVHFVFKYAVIKLCLPASFCRTAECGT